MIEGTIRYLGAEVGEALEIAEQTDVLTVGGAGRRIRTADFLITNEALYQLSYTGTG